MPDPLVLLLSLLVLYLFILVQGEDERIADELTKEDEDCN